MIVIVDAIAKKSKFDAEKRTTKITMFDLELGDDIDLKFPGDLTAQPAVKPGTPIHIEGLFRVSHFQSGQYLTAVDDQFKLEQVGKLDFFKRSPAPSDDGDKKKQ